MENDTKMFIVYFSLRFPYCLSVKALQVISFTNVRYIYLVNQEDSCAMRYCQKRKFYQKVVVSMKSIKR